MNRRTLLAALGAALLLGGLWFSFGPPRITLLNAGLRIDYPWPQGAAALLAGLGAAAAAASLEPRWARIGFALLAAAALWLGLQRLAYRLETDDAGVAEHGAFGSTPIAWREVSKVDNGPAVVLIWGRGETQIRIRTGRFSPEQRATLDRSVARHVRETQPGK